MRSRPAPHVRKLRSLESVGRTGGTFRSTSCLHNGVSTTDCMSVEVTKEGSELRVWNTYRLQDGESVGENSTKSA